MVGYGKNMIETLMQIPDLSWVALISANLFIGDIQTSYPYLKYDNQAQYNGLLSGL